MNKFNCAIIFCFLLLNVISIVNTKPTFSTNPITLSIFSPQKDEPETHITKIPYRSAKQIETTTTEIPTNPPPSFVEQKIGKVFQKLLTISQLANSLKSAPTNLVLEQNDDGLTLEDQTNPPPSFVEQKIGRIVEKLFRFSQFASNVRETFNQPNHVFEYFNERESNEKDNDNNDFDGYFNERTDSKEDQKQYIPLIIDGIGNSEAIEAIKIFPSNNKEERLLKSEVTTERHNNKFVPEVLINNEKLPNGKHEYIKSKESDVKETKNLVDEEAFKVYIYNKDVLKLEKNIDNSNVTTQNLSDNNSKHLNSTNILSTTGKIDFVFIEDVINSTNLNLNLNLTSNDIDNEQKIVKSKDNDNEVVPINKNDQEDQNSGVKSLKQTAEQVGYFVLELFASLVGLTLGALTQINHAFHTSNNTILVGIYNSTH